MMFETVWSGQGLGMLLVALIFLLPFWRICRKAGYSGWLSLLMLVPVANLLLLYFLAFARWPNARRQ